MAEKKKNVFELLIFAVILLAVILYYVVPSHNSKEKSDAEQDISTEQTIIPIETEAADKPQLEQKPDMPSVQMKNDASVSAKSDEYHNETEGEQ